MLLDVNYIGGRLPHGSISDAIFPEDGRSRSRMPAPQPWSNSESCPQISRLSGAALGLSPGGFAGPEIRGPGLWGLCNQAAGAAIFSMKAFRSKNQGGLPHLRA